MAVFRRRLLYLTNDHLTACPWETGGHTNNGRIFSNDEAGWAEFSRYLGGSPGTPIYFLADLVEEDFQRDTLPHVLGKSRRALVQRRLVQLYRDTPYRQAVRQGREAQGRKDDRMLFSALTNADLLKPWLDAILTQKVPLAGIYSPALLSTALIKKLDLASGNLLLLTHQSSGLRQSFFKDSVLKFSRLTPLSEHDPDTVADAAARETANTQQFLVSARLLQRDERLGAVVLAHRNNLPQLQSSCQDTPAIGFRFLDLADAAARHGLKNPASVALCDPLFLSLLGQAGTASHYAQAEQTRFFRLRQTRLALYLLSAAVVAGALLPAGSNSLEAWQHYEQSRQMAIETTLVQAQYQAIIRSLPYTAVSPQNMKAAVNIEQMLAHNAPEPTALLSIVSRALDTLPQIRIDQLSWQASAKTALAGEALNSSPAPAPGIEEKPAATLLGIPEKPEQTLLIEGEVVSLRQDYRTALESVRLFVADLVKNTQLHAEITKSPLDIAPGARLTGKAGDEDADNKARFSLKLIFLPEN